MQTILLTLATLYALYVVSYAIWNVFLHPMRHIPGPKLWIAFPLLRYVSSLRGRIDIDVRAFHNHYGPVVRFTPHEVSFITADAWKEIYGHGHTQLPKAVISIQDRKNILTSDDADHSRYRKSLSHAFSAKGLQAQEPVLMQYVDKLVGKLRGVAESQLPADMVKWYNLTTFDLIGDLAFGESFGGLDSSRYHHWVRTIFESSKFLSFFQLKDAYPVLFMMLVPFIPRSLREARVRSQEHTTRTVQKRVHGGEERGHGDFMDSMLRHRDDEDGLTDQELALNARILILAGSETTATLLAGVTYWLLRTPDAMEKVTHEVRSAMQTEDEITFNNVTTQLPYLLACLNEALRMYPPVPGGLQRMTPSGGFTEISGYRISGGTKVSVHQVGAYWSEHNFHQADRFIPERWLPDAREPSSPFFGDSRDVLQPFSVGPRNCIGKNLAYSEMRVILARVLWNFDLELCEESRAWNEQKTYGFWEKPPLMCRLQLR